MIRLPGVKDSVDGSLVIEITVTPIQRQRWRRDGNDEGARPALYGFIPLSRSHDDDLMPVTGSPVELRIHVGPHAAAGRRIKSTNVDDPHRPLKAGMTP